MSTTTSPHRSPHPGLDVPVGDASWRRAGTGSRLTALDGLRGVAVLLVLGYHAWPEVLPGGNIGVDVFFVLSGFFVTTALARSAEAGRLPWTRVRAFWSRRLLRLVPALLAALVVLTAASLLLYPAIPARLPGQWLAAVTWTTNWTMLGQGGGYFAQYDPLMWQHLWSLGIEMQYYLVWPIGMLLFLHLARTHDRHTGRRGLVLLTIALAVQSAVLFLLVVGLNGLDQAYLATPTHVFGLFAGSAVALMPGSRTPRLAARRRVAERVVGGAGIAVLVLMAAFVHPSDGWASAAVMPAAALVATLLTVYLATSGPGEAVLGTQVLGWFGRRSYAIYLWHWPLLVLLNQGAQAPVGETPWRSALAVVTSLAAAEVSWRMIEAPALREGWNGVALRFRVGMAGALDRPWTLAAFGALAAFLLLMCAAALASSPSTGELEGLLTPWR